MVYTTPTMQERRAHRLIDVVKTYLLFVYTGWNDFVSMSLFMLKENVHVNTLLETMVFSYKIVYKRLTFSDYTHANRNIINTKKVNDLQFFLFTFIYYSCQGPPQDLGTERWKHSLPCLVKSGVRWLE